MSSPEGDARDFRLRLHTNGGDRRGSSHENMTKHLACITNKGIMAVYLGHPFYIIIDNFGKMDVPLRIHRKGR